MYLIISVILLCIKHNFFVPIFLKKGSKSFRRMFSVLSEYLCTIAIVQWKLNSKLTTVYVHFCSDFDSVITNLDLKIKKNILRVSPYGVKNDTAE